MGKRPIPGRIRPMADRAMISIKLPDGPDDNAVVRVSTVCRGGQRARRPEAHAGHQKRID